MSSISYTPNTPFVTEADPQRQEMARLYAKERGKATIGIAIIGIVFGIVWASPAVASTARTWISSISSYPAFVAGAFALLLGLLLVVACTYSSYLQSYKLPYKYGLVTRTPLSWWQEYLRSVTWLLTLWVLLAEVVYWLIRESPDTWWVWVATLWCGLLIFRSSGLPSDKFMGLQLETPANPEPERRLANLAAQAGLPRTGLYVLPISRKMHIVNAWIRGFGPTRRVFMTDTMLETLNPEEIDTVLAHELAHQARRDLEKSLALRCALTLPATYLIHEVALYLTNNGTSGNLADPANLPYLGAAFIIAQVFISSIDGNRSRKAERYADAFAIALTGKPDAFKSAMIKLADLNLLQIHPHQGRSEKSSTHPTMGERIDTADMAAGRQPARAGRLYAPEAAMYRRQVAYQSIDMTQGERIPRNVRRIFRAAK